MARMRQVDPATLVGGKARLQELTIERRAVVDVGVALRQLRSEKGLSQVALAECSGVDQRQISDIERGILAQGPTVATLARLAEALGTTSRDFFVPKGAELSPSAKALSNKIQADAGSGALSLTPRQLEVMRCVREGKSNKVIARDLGMMESTVKIHVRSIMRNLGANSRTQVALQAQNLLVVDEYLHGVPHTFGTFDPARVEVTTPETHDSPTGTERNALEVIGTVKWFNATKGYGFIQPDDGGPDVFVHISAVEQAGLGTLSDGQKVRFEKRRDPKRGKIYAEDLEAG